MKALSGVAVFAFSFAFFSVGHATPAPKCDALFATSSASIPSYSLQNLTSGGLVGFQNPTTGKKEMATNVIGEVFGNDGVSRGWISFAEAAMRGLKFEGYETFDKLPEGTLGNLIVAKGLGVYATQRAAFEAPKNVERTLAREALKPIVAIAVDATAPPKYRVGEQISAGLRFFKDPATGENSGGTHSVFELYNANGMLIGWINNVEAGLLGLKFNGMYTFDNLAPGILQALIEVNGLTIYQDANSALRFQVGR